MISSKVKTPRTPKQDHTELKRSPPTVLEGVWTGTSVGTICEVTATFRGNTFRSYNHDCTAEQGGGAYWGQLQVQGSSLTLWYGYSSVPDMVGTNYTASFSIEGNRLTVVNGGQRSSLVKLSP